MRGWLRGAQHRAAAKKGHGSGGVVPQLIHQHLAVLGKLCLGLPEGKAARGRGGRGQPEDYQRLHVHALQECQGEGQAGYGPTALEYLLVHLRERARSGGPTLALTPAAWSPRPCRCPYRAQEQSDAISGYGRPPAPPFAPLGLAIPLSHISVPPSVPPCDLGLSDFLGGGVTQAAPVQVPHLPSEPDCAHGGGGGTSPAHHT